MKILNVVGARQNFMKIAPLMAEYGRHENIHAILVHTAQRYGEIMSNFFFSELGIPEPDIKTQKICCFKQSKAEKKDWAKSIRIRWTQ